MISPAVSGRNLKLGIEYDGINYYGWQKQSNHKLKTIQETIETTLQKILQEKAHLTASGRTDARVHALGQIANFKTNSNISLEKLKKGLNALLPDDIVIKKIEEADSNFHSRFSVKSKIYRYLILNRNYPSVFLKNRVYFCPYKLNLKLMQREARDLLGKHNFKVFCASGSNVKNTIRTIMRISVKKVYLDKIPLISIEVEADGFLYNMVRSIAGTLIEVGRGKFLPGITKKILSSQNRKLCGPTAPASGLYLVKVKY